MNIAFALLVLLAMPNEGTLRTFNVEGTKRQAVVQKNTNDKSISAPLVFVFHGRGGKAQGAASRFQIQKHWPEAVVVYMQALADPNRSNKSAGWQRLPNEQDDCDVKFFDVALNQIQPEYRTDPNRVYVLGYSSGARFVNVLWKLRGDKLAAICSAAAQGGRLIRDCEPKSIFMVMGERDTVVPFDLQRRSIDLVRKTLNTDPSKAKTEGLSRRELGGDDTELVIYIHPGGHEFPQEATPSVVKFFQRHKRK